MATQVADALNSASNSDVWSVDKGTVGYTDPKTGIPDHILDVKSEEISKLEEAAGGEPSPKNEKGAKYIGYKEEGSTNLGGVESRTLANQGLAKENSAFSPKYYTSVNAYGDALTTLVESDSPKTNIILDETARQPIVDAIKSVFDAIKTNGDVNTEIENYKTVINNAVENEAIKSNSATYLQYKVPYLMEQLNEYPDTFEFTSPASFRFKDNFDVIDIGRSLAYQTNDDGLMDRVNTLAQTMVKTGDLSPEQYDELINKDPTTPISQSKINVLNDFINQYAPATSEEVTGIPTGTAIIPTSITPATQVSLTPLSRVSAPTSSVISTPLITATTPISSISFDPLTTQQLSQYAASLGLSPTTIFDKLPAFKYSFFLAEHN